MMDYEVMKTQLTGDYRAAFDRAQTYVMTSNFEGAYSDDKMMELYDLLLTAQTEQKPAEQIVGKDAAAFVTNFFSDHKRSWQDLLSAIANSLKRLSIILLAVTALDFFNDTEKAGFLSVRTDISMILAGLLGGMALVAVSQFILRPASMKTKKINSTGWAFILMGLFIGIIVLEMVLRHNRELNVPAAPLMIGCAAYLLGYYTVRSIWRLKHHGTLRDIHKEQAQDSYYKELPDRDIERIFIKGLLKRYQRLARKGKVTEESFLGKMEREEKWVVRSNLFFTVCMIAIVLYWIIESALTHSFMETLLFAVFISVIEWLIWKLFIGTSKKTSAMRLRIYAACRKCGMTLPAYLESQSEKQ